MDTRYHERNRKWSQQSDYNEHNQKWNTQVDWRYLVCGTLQTNFRFHIIPVPTIFKFHIDRIIPLPSPIAHWSQSNVHRPPNTNTRWQRSNAKLSHGLTMVLIMPSSHGGQTFHTEKFHAVRNRKKGCRFKALRC